MYNKIKNNSKYFKAFCTLPMRDPKSAALELRRCIKDLGMVGALINGIDILYKEPINSTFPNMFPLFYDGKKNSQSYDVLWQTFQDLDVPLYIHPTVYNTINNNNPDTNILNFYDEYPSLPGSAWGFSINLAQHILRLIISGVFDRFPRFKLILGHLGEMLPWWIERFDHRICIWKNERKRISDKDFKKYKLPEFELPKLPLIEYFKRNIYITTSGWFSNNALDYCIKTIGVDRILFSIDYPYEDQKIASDWLDNIEMSKEDKEKIAYKNAAELLKIKI
jgi:2,3-dihydroxybenzoate decarboxylase